MSDLQDGKDEKGHFAKGNRFWATCSSFGRKPLFADGDQLWSACLEYFEWVEENPLIEARPMSAGGVVQMVEVPRMRAMTLNGLCTFLDINRGTWCDWRAERADLKETIERVDQIIYEQKFTGAAADLLNAGFIGRELGLADKREHTGPNGGPIRTVNSEMTPQEAAEAYAATLDAEKG